MLRKYYSYTLPHIILFFMLGFVTNASNAQTGVASDRVSISCSGIDIVQVNFNQNGGWIGHRAWGAGGSKLYDDYTGLTNHFVLMPANEKVMGIPAQHIAFQEQPVGTVINTRVYRALSNSANSWDGGSFVNTAFTCFHGAHLQNDAKLTCSNFLARGKSGNIDGFIGARVWRGPAGGTPLYDGYTIAFTHWGQISVRETGFQFNVGFPPQPVGTQLTARVYRALVPEVGSWDGADFQDMTVNCAN